VVAECSATDVTNSFSEIRNGLIACRYLNAGRPILPKERIPIPEDNNTPKDIMEFLTFVSLLLNL
jgi:hypothetical protein